jgi:hypothetical protein
VSERETGEALHLTLDVRGDAVDEVEPLLARHAASPGWSALSVLRVNDTPRLHLVARWEGDSRPAAAGTLLEEIEASAETQLTSPPAVDGCAVLAAEAGDGGGARSRPAAAAGSSTSRSRRGPATRPSTSAGRSRRASASA